MYVSDDNEIKLDKEENQNFNERIISVFNDVPVFESLRDTFIDDTLDNSVPYSPSVFGQLQIDSINLNEYVVSGTNEKDLEFGPGHYLQTSLPGNGGNVGIAGHRTTFGAPFANLGEVQIGDEVILTVNNKKFHYTIDEVSVVEATGGEYVLFNRGDDRLTLTTCHPRYSAKQRLVVTGILTKIESAN
jgi:LPXTG-site transpeptidase (sortase) family protein